MTTNPFATKHPGTCNASHNGGCSKCHLFRHRADVRKAWGGDPTLAEPEPGVVSLPVLPCRFRGDDLTGPERQAAGLDHARQWVHCRHPKIPLGPNVCACRGCGPMCSGYGQPYPDGTVVIEQGAGGIGDMALLLPCVNSLKLADPDKSIVLRLGPIPLPFAREFHGWDGLEDNPRLHNEQPVADARQANLGYTAENRAGYAVPRWERYQRNISAPGFVIPPLRDPDRIRAAGADLAGAAVLCPGSTDKARQWSVHHWLTLERLLLAAGYRTAVLDIDAARVGHFKGTKVISGTTERVLGVLSNAAVVIGTDSGMAHLGGLLRRPTVVLGGSTPVARIFGAYPTATGVQGQLDCSGCGGGTGVPIDPPYEDRCRQSCSNLQSITPERVMAAVPPLPLVRYTPPADTRAVLDLVTARRPLRLLEVGTAEGHMTANLTRWSPPDAVVHSVGLTREMGVPSGAAEQSDELPTRAEFGRAVDHFGTGSKARLVEADSRWLDFSAFGPLDFVFVDGGHDAATVQSDTLKAYTALAPGGLLIWHDWPGGSWAPVAETVTGLHLPEPITHIPGTMVAWLEKSPRDLSELIPFREYTDADDAEQRRHLDSDTWLYAAGKEQWVCSILGTVHQGLADRPDLARLVRRAVFMARWMNDRGARQDRLDWTGSPKNG